MSEPALLKRMGNLGLTSVDLRVHMLFWRSGKLKLRFGSINSNQLVKSSGPVEHLLLMTRKGIPALTRHQEIQIQAFVCIWALKLQ